MRGAYHSYLQRTKTMALKGYTAQSLNGKYQRWAAVGNTLSRLWTAHVQKIFCQPRRTSCTSHTHTHSISLFESVDLSQIHACIHETEEKTGHNAHIRTHTHSCKHAQHQRTVHVPACKGGGQRRAGFMHVIPQPPTCSITLTCSHTSSERQPTTNADTHLYGKGTKRRQWLCRWKLLP